MSDNIFIILNTLGICVVFVLLIIIILKYNAKVFQYNNLKYLINKQETPYVLGENDPLRIKMVYKPLIDKSFNNVVSEEIRDTKKN